MLSSLSLLCSYTLYILIPIPGIVILYIQITAEGVLLMYLPHRHADTSAFIIDKGKALLACVRGSSLNVSIPAHWVPVECISGFSSHTPSSCTNCNYVRQISVECNQPHDRERVKKIDPLSLSGKGKRLIYPGIALFSSKKAAEEFFWDIKLYMESCSTPNSATEALLITNDKHHFFRFFQLSKVMFL